MSDQPKADYVYNVDAWETTYPDDMLSELTEDLSPGEIMHVGRLKEMTPTWAASVPVAWDEDGDPDDWEVEEFPTREAAEAATKRKVAP